MIIIIMLITVARVVGSHLQNLLGLSGKSNLEREEG